MNYFLTPNPEGERPERPKRVYMRLDQVDGDRALFEAVSADFMDARWRSEGDGTFRQWVGLAEMAPIYVVDMPFGAAAAFWWWYRRPWLSQVDAEGASPWMMAVVEPGSQAELYPNLFQAPLSIDVVHLEPANEAVEVALNQLFDLEPLERTEQEIQNRLDLVTGLIDWVGVYDVGQGSANGACDSSTQPLIYFDLGGGVLGNRATWPTAMSDFCYGADPPVVLSHWDWDHWSSGSRLAGALALDWIVPVQKMGSVHATFAATLHAAGHLFVWPGTTSQLVSGQLTVSKCLGRGVGRNHTGLAMEIEGPNNQAPILLPGDARYSAVPGALSRDYTSLVAPHHGADMKNRQVPAHYPNAGARVAYSFGAGNTFSHPRPVTEADHQRANWDHLSQRAATPIDRNTANRQPNGLGHVGLSWQLNPVLPLHACGSAACTVNLQQV